MKLASLAQSGPRLREPLSAAARQLAQADVDSPRLVAEVLLAHALGVSRAHLLAHLNDPALHLADGLATFWMRLSAGNQGSVRPEAVLTALGLGEAYAQVERTKLLFEFDSQ